MGDVPKIPDEYRQVQCATAIQECKASGLSNKEYCIQHGLSDSRPRFPPYIVAGLRELTCSYKPRSVIVCVTDAKKASLIGETFLLVLALPIFPASHPASIVGADELNFCVRDGNRWTLIAINTNYVGWVLPISFMSKPSLGSNCFLL